ncbi:MAG: hypothetical protein AAGB51_12955 [Planctomycetota bacterium]
MITRGQLYLVDSCAALACLFDGCVSNRLYNKSPSQYIVSVTQPPKGAVCVDIAMIEFGMLWMPEQFEAALSMIDERNASSKPGIILVSYTQGWINNADPDSQENDLAHFEESERALRQLHAEGTPAPDRVVGVLLGWRGATNRILLWSTLPVWERKDAAECVASYQMRKSLFRLTAAAKARRDSKVLHSDHSMGETILARTLAPTLSTLLLVSISEEARAPADMVILQSPALDGLAAFQRIEYLNRTEARLKYRHTNGKIEVAQGPMIASITSEADWVTEMAYHASHISNNLSRAFRDDLGDGIPSQGKFANRAHGQVDFLVSNRADARRRAGAGACSQRVQRHAFLDRPDHRRDLHESRRHLPRELCRFGSAHRQAQPSVRHRIRQLDRAEASPIITSKANFALNEMISL